MPGTQLEIPRLSQPLMLRERVGLIVGDDDQAGHYYTRIEDFLSQGIIISAPEFEGGKTLLREGAAVTVVITRPDATYRCQSTISRISQDNVQSYLLSPPRNARRLQRRRSVRVVNSDPITYAIITKVMEWENYDDRAEWVESRCIDVSGHGVLMTSEEGLEVGHRLLLRLELFQRLELPETVIGICRRLDVDQDRPVAGVELLTNDQMTGVFTSEEIDQLPGPAREFNSIKRNLLINHLFHEQIELRQKGLL